MARRRRWCIRSISGSMYVVPIAADEDDAVPPVEHSWHKQSDKLVTSHPISVARGAISHNTSIYHSRSHNVLNSVACIWYYLKGVKEPISSVETIVVHRQSSMQKGDSHFERLMPPGCT